MISDRVRKEIARHQKTDVSKIKPVMFWSDGRFSLYEVPADDSIIYYMAAKGIETSPVLKVSDSLWCSYTPRLSDLANRLSAIGQVSLDHNKDLLVKQIVNLSPAGSAQINKHMPGKHDQSVHGRRKQNKINPTSVTRRHPITYHGTIQSVVDDIRTNGIQPSTLTGNSVWGMIPESESDHERASSVYVSQSYSDAIQYGASAANLNNAKYFVVFDVQVPDNEYVYPDELDKNSFRLSRVSPDWIVGQHIYALKGHENNKYTVERVTKSKRVYVIVIVK
jgi:hypothetical protein